MPSKRRRFEPRETSQNSPPSKLFANKGQITVVAAGNSFAPFIPPIPSFPPFYGVPVDSPCFQFVPGFPVPIPASFPFYPNPYLQGLIPPPPPDEEFIIPPPPPDEPPSNKQSIEFSNVEVKEVETKKSLIDSPAISTAVCSRPRILNRREAFNFPPHWGRDTLNSYSIIDKVGEGSYGSVYKATRKDELIALKKVHVKNEQDGFSISTIREINLLQSLDHPNIMKLKDVIAETIEAGTPGKGRKISAFFLVFEYVEHDMRGLLESGIVKFSECQVALLFKQLLLALQHCHSRNIIHRDLKCANILINRGGRLKLGDFGMARVRDGNEETLYTNKVVTIWYRSPELLLGERKYGSSIDMWSAGCVLGELFTRKPIFRGENEQQQLEYIAKCCGTPTASVWPGLVNLPMYANMRFSTHHVRSLRDRFSGLPPGALDIFDNLLSLDPRRRLCATKVLEHPWLKKLDPSQIPALSLPMDQDCHERWMRQQRSEKYRVRRLTSLNVANQSQGTDSTFNSDLDLSRL